MTEKKDKRLAQGLTDATPREWNAREKYMLYVRGFRDGAGVHAMRPDHEGLIAYDRGYEDGRKARADAVAKYCEEIGYKPTILRTQDAES